MSGNDDFFADFGDELEDILGANLTERPDPPALVESQLPSNYGFSYALVVTDEALSYHTDKPATELNKDDITEATEKLEIWFEQKLKGSEVLEYFIQELAVDPEIIPNITIQLTSINSAYGISGLDIHSSDFTVVDQRTKFSGFRIRPIHYIEIDVCRPESELPIDDSIDVLTHELGHTLTQALPCHSTIYEGFAQFTSYIYRRAQQQELGRSTINELPIIAVNKPSGGLYFPQGVDIEKVHPLGRLLGEIGGKQLIGAFGINELETDLAPAICKFKTIIAKTYSRAVKYDDGSVFTHKLEDWLKITDEIDPNFAKKLFSDPLMQKPAQQSEFTLWVPHGPINQTQDSSWGVIYSFELTYNTEFGLLPKSFPNHLEPKTRDFCNDLGHIEPTPLGVVFLDRDDNVFASLQTQESRLELSPDLLLTYFDQINDDRKIANFIDSVTDSFSIWAINKEGDFVLLSENMSVDEELFDK